MAGEVMTIPTEIFSVGQETNEKTKYLVEEIDANSIPQLKVDPEIKHLCRPLGDEERRLLENDIKEHGCIDPIIYWSGHDIIIDGHNRHDICIKYGKPCKCIGLRFESKEDAMNYVIDHQLGRRNLSDLEKSYLRGKRYLTEKKAPHRPSDQELHQNEVLPGETAERIAKQSGVSSATIERDANLAEALDKIRDAVGDEFVNGLRSEKTKLSKKGIDELSKQPVEDMKVLADYVEKGTKLSDAKELLESRKSFLSSSPVDSPPLPKKDKSLERLERHLGQAIKILNMMDTASLPDNLDELLAISQEIQERLKAIGAKNADPIKKDIVSNPNTEVETNMQKANLEIENLACEDELDDESIEMFSEDIVDDQESYPELQDGWDEYQDAMDAESEIYGA